MKNGDIHSEEWITDAREYWWNEDYLELILNRYNLKHISSLADIGCGKGYMSFKLLPHLNKLKKIYGRDIETTYINSAISKSQEYKDLKFDFRVRNAENLDINDNTVDLCICQTLLLHLNDPKNAIKEMIRITKENGTIMAIETNNSINSLIRNNILEENDITSNIADIKETIKLLEYDLTIQKGVYNLKEGYLSIGDSIPKLFYELGLKNINVSIVDKACSLIPPYDTPEKKSRVKELIDLINSSSSEYDYNQMLKYYIAGGGNKKDFDIYWNLQNQKTKKIKKAIEDEKYIMPGGALMYIITGNK